MPKRQDIHTVLIIGAGPIVIGQACEFDYSGAQACKALRAEGYRVVEGLRCLDLKAFSVQYHPEAAAGPHDADHLFDRFRDLIVAGHDTDANGDAE